jgi:hypothetical protein
METRILFSFGPLVVERALAHAGKRATERAFHQGYQGEALG